MYVSIQLWILFGILLIGVLVLWFLIGYQMGKIFEDKRIKKEFEKWYKEMKIKEKDYDKRE